MENSYIEYYLPTLLIIHVVLSILLAIVSSFYMTKRFTSKKEDTELKDEQRLKKIEHRGRVYKLLFKVSLHKNNRITTFIFMFFFNLSTPVVGYLLSIWITLYLKHVKYEKVVANTNILNLDEFGTSFLKIERIFGEGSMIELLNSDYAPRSKKLKALSSLANSNTPANLKIIRSTLSSADDEVRMFGYAIINKAEKALNIKINTQLEKYNRALALQEQLDEGDMAKQKELIDEDIASSANELAHLYWELVYTEISHESLKDEFLREVIKYVAVAKAGYRNLINKLENAIDADELMLKELSSERDELIDKLEDDKQRLRNFVAFNTKLFILMGRVYMSKEEYEDASTEFVIAQETGGATSSLILPYLAEIQFLAGNYKTVNAILNRAKDLGVNAKLHPIVEQWKVS